MEEIWKVIEEIPNYECSNMGHVRRIGNILPLVPKEAYGGTKFVTMTRDGKQYSRSIKVLVAHMFVPNPYDPAIFDTPIQCSLSTDNLKASNIKWRPLWHAMRFRRQLHPKTYPLYYETPVMNLDTSTQHASILTAAIHDGVLMQDIYRSAGEGRTVFPTGDRYEFMWRIDNDFPSVHWDGV